jgi:nicotinamide-nucleotide amidase
LHATGKAPAAGENLSKLPGLQMTAEILSIGDELLIGQITNTNSVWLAQQLNRVGIRVSHMATVGDNEAAILQAFRHAMARADFVFITGGLGPTRDDITKKTFATFFEAELQMDESVLEEVEDFFAKRGRVVSEVNRRQALVPKGCFVIRNPHGTAPGMWMKKKSTVFISLPGVPYEMQAMVTETVLPKIVSEHKLPAIYHKTVLTQGIGESVLAEMIEEWETALSAKGISLAYLPQPGIVKLRLSCEGADLELLKTSVEEEIGTLQKLAGKYIYGYQNYGEESPTLEQVLSDLLRERGKTIALAESCTGGYLSSLLTMVPGASEVFKGAIVPYTNNAKHHLLQVDKKIFETVGAVSKECVLQLAKNVLKKFSSDYAISISGIAGPTGGTPQKRVGTVWIGIASAEKAVAMKYRFGDNRQRNIIMSANAAMNMLRKFILRESRKKA